MPPDASAATPPPSPSSAWISRCAAALEAERARLAQRHAPFRRLSVESDLLGTHHRVLLWGYDAKPRIAVSFEEDPTIDAAQARPWEDAAHECPSDEERLKPERVRVYVGGIGRVLVRGSADDATIAASLRAAVDACAAAVAAPNR